MIYKSYDIVVVPFPFIDSSNVKKRPALVLSSHEHFNNKISHSIMAMITSARNQPWPLDTPITNLLSAGLPNHSVIRLKFFTIDHRLIIEKIGQLSQEDQKIFRHTFKHVFQEI